MVARHPKKSFKTTVSIVSSNVIQKVVTLKSSCSHHSNPPEVGAPPPPPPKHVPKEVRFPMNGTIQDDLCCGRPLPLTITVTDEDTASELSCEFFGNVEERPPTPRPKTVRKTLNLRSFCIPESASDACVLPKIATKDMEWPSDEEEDDEDDDSLGFAAAQFLPSSSRLESVCGLQWPSMTRPNSWGLMIVDREDEDEGIRFASSTRDDGLTSSGSTYEYREPMVTLRNAPVYTS